MDMYKLKFTRLQYEIIRLLMIKAGEKLTQRNIAECLKVSPTAIAKSIPQLEKDSMILLKKSDKMNLNLVELNRNSPKTIELKRAENLKIIYESGLSDFLEEKFPTGTIILFGSYSRGDDTARSDIDIAIIKSKPKEINLTEYEKKLEREIRINFYNSVKDINKELKEKLFNGIVLAGGIEL